MGAIFRSDRAWEVSIELDSFSPEPLWSQLVNVITR